MARQSKMYDDHPGTFILEELNARGWAQLDLAYVLGMSGPQLNPILKGKQKITPDLAVALGDAFGVPAEDFANLQKLYDLQRAKAADPGVKTRGNWLSIFPIRTMINRGWIEETEPDLLELQMLRFFDKNRLTDIPFIGEGEITPFAAKKNAYDQTTPIQYVWLHRVKKVAERMVSPAYSADKLRECLPSIRAHMLDKDDLIEIPSILRKCGVRFVLVEALPGSKIDGVCLWMDGQPVIGMTTRLDRMDNFCFVLRHEIEHVLNEDGKEETFSPVDELVGSPDSMSNLPQEEVIANLAAGDFLIPKRKMDSFFARKSPFISEKDVLAFAARMEIHPAIVVGQIQFKTKKYTWLRKYQTSIRKYVSDWEYTDGWGVQAPTGL